MEFDHMTIAATDPIGVQNGNIELLQTLFFSEAEDATGGTSTVSRAAFSGGSGKSANGTGSDLNYNFTSEHTIPDGELGFSFRYFVPSGSSNPSYELIIDNSETVETVGSGVLQTDTVTWVHAAGSIGDLGAGSHNALIDITSSGDWEIDCIAVYDDRFYENADFDNTVDGDGWLSSPGLYPEGQLVTLNQTTTERDISEITVTQTWNDVSNNQYIEISDDGGSTWNRTDNSQTATLMPSDPTQTVDVRMNLSRFGSRSTATPTSGFQGQTIDDHDLAVDLDAISPDGIGVDNVSVVVPPNTITGTTLREAGELDSNNNLLTHVIFAEFDVESGQRVISSETVTWAND